MAEVESHERVACLQARHEHRHVSLCAGVRLHVDIRSAVELLEASACEFLHLVNHLATTIITVGRIALGVLVGQHAAHSLQYLVGYVVLAGDKFDTFGLTLTLHADEVKNLLVFHTIIVLDIRFGFHLSISTFQFSPFSMQSYIFFCKIPNISVTLCDFFVI